MRVLAVPRSTAISWDLNNERKGNICGDERRPARTNSNQSICLTLDPNNPCGCQRIVQCVPFIFKFMSVCILLSTGGLLLYDTRERLEDRAGTWQKVAALNLTSKSALHRHRQVALV